MIYKFQPTLPARGATPCVPCIVAGLIISTHAPRTGSDRWIDNDHDQHPEFQPTLPARGATRKFYTFSYQYANFNPRSPHGERRLRARKGQGNDRHFNPRSPHGERPQPLLCRVSAGAKFQPTLPARGATNIWRYHPAAVGNFNPRSPHGERQPLHLEKKQGGGISTHAPRTGSDANTFFACAMLSNFNPRSPHGERRTRIPGEDEQVPISTHAPRTGSDAQIQQQLDRAMISTHAPRTGSDRVLVRR